MQDTPDIKQESQPSSTPTNGDKNQPELGHQTSPLKESQSSVVIQSSGSESDQTTQPEDPEEVKLKEDISQISQQKALLKKELNDSQPPGNDYPFLCTISDFLERKGLVAILDLLDEIEPCLSRAQLFSKHFSTCSDDTSIESWLPLITDELCDAFHLLEQWEEHLGDSVDMARQFPDLEERSGIRRKMDTLHEAFYELRESVLLVLRERMGQMTKEIPEEIILKFTRVCINIPCITARYWAEGARKHHFDQLRHFFEEGVLPSECIAEFCGTFFGAMKFNTHMDILREIYREVFDRVQGEVNKYSNWDKLGTFEVKEPFDWKFHQHQSYFQAILPLDLYGVFARSSFPIPDAEKTQFDKQGTMVLYRWMEFVNGYKILCKANDEYEYRWPGEASLLPPYDFSHTVKVYAQAIRGIRETELGGFARMRIGLMLYALLGERHAARRAFESALKECRAETPTDLYYNTGWAIQCRKYLSDMEMKEKAEAELKAKQEKERQERQQKEKEEAEHQAKLQQEKAERERSDFYLTHNLDVLGFKTMEVNGAQSLLSLLRWVTDTFKPPDEMQRARLEDLVTSETISRSKFMKIIMVYHPDKNSKENENWKKACEEVTKVSTYTCTLFREIETDVVRC
jgi:hypothetical protein